MLRVVKRVAEPDPIVAHDPRIPLVLVMPVMLAAKEPLPWRFKLAPVLREKEPVARVRLRVAGTFQIWAPVARLRFELIVRLWRAALMSMPAVPRVRVLVPPMETDPPGFETAMPCHERFAPRAVEFAPETVAFHDAMSAAPGTAPTDQLATSLSALELSAF